MTDVIFEKLTLSVMAEMVEEKILQYEASIYDAKLEMNLALAAGQNERFASEVKRMENLTAGLLFLREEQAAQNERLEDHPVALATANEPEEEG